jgi:hypothetical protein
MINTCAKNTGIDMYDQKYIVNRIQAAFNLQLYYCIITSVNKYLCAKICYVELHIFSYAHLELQLFSR